jgi:hypothetical protein
LKVNNFLLSLLLVSLIIFVTQNLIAQNQSLSDQLADIRSDIAKARKSTRKAKVYLEARARAEGLTQTIVGLKLLSSLTKGFSSVMYYTPVTGIEMLKQLKLNS